MIQTIAPVTRLEDRPRLFGMSGALFGLSSIIDPLIGDTFRDHVSSFHYSVICLCTAYRLFAHSLITGHLGMFLSIFLPQIPFLAQGYSNSGGVSLSIFLSAASIAQPLYSRSSHLHPLGPMLPGARLGISCDKPRGWTSLVRR